jgi:fibronectin-binding autotransporter adhesin
MSQMKKEFEGKRVRVFLAVSFALAVLVALGLAAGIGVTSLSSVASAYEYSTTITTSTSTSTSTTTTPTVTKPGKGCGDKNHLHDRRFECKVTIASVSKKEGSSGATAFVFTLSVSGSPLSTVTVDWATGGGTAAAVTDYSPANGTVSFAPGVTTRTVTISVIGNTVPEPNETFYVNLSNPSPNAYLGNTQGVGTILNDD